MKKRPDKIKKYLLNINEEKMELFKLLCKEKKVPYSNMVEELIKNYLNEWK